MSPYAPPGSVRDARPAVIFWYRAYAGLMTLAALALVVLSMVTGGAGPVALAVGALLAGFYGLATFVPFRPWGWTVGLVAIGLGLAGGTALFAIPLLFFWFKPVVKAAFARV